MSLLYFVEQIYLLCGWDGIWSILFWLLSLSHWKFYLQV